VVLEHVSRDRRADLVVVLVEGRVGRREERVLAAREVDALLGERGRELVMSASSWPRATPSEPQKISGPSMVARVSVIEAWSCVEALGAATGAKAVTAGARARARASLAIFVSDCAERVA
jgi:hypothetical protein